MVVIDDTVHMRKFCGLLNAIQILHMCMCIYMYYVCTQLGFTEF